MRYSALSDETAYGKRVAFQVVTFKVSSLFWVMRLSGFTNNRQILSPLSRDGYFGESFLLSELYSIFP